MSQFLARSAVAKENLMQVARRIRIENRLANEIKALKEELKTKSTVISALLELGLTRKHAVAVEMRLQWELEAEEEKARRLAEKEAKARAEAEKAKAEPVETGAGWDSRTATPEEREAILGKPLADALPTQSSEPGEAVVTAVDVETKTITVTTVEG